MNGTVDADMNSGPCVSDLRRAGRINGNIDRKDTKVGIGIGSILARYDQYFCDSFPSGLPANYSNFLRASVQVCLSNL